ncbi:hypothetical protein Q5752_006393 [Cryptotrichosporon argae]
MDDDTTAQGLDSQDPTYTHFAHRESFLDLLGRFLQLDVAVTPTVKQTQAETVLLESLGAILDHYLPLPGLLDPSLDEIVTPLMAVVADSTDRLAAGEQLDESRLARVGRLVNWVVKVRGWKAVVPYFPSAIRHLAVLVDLLLPTLADTVSRDQVHPYHHFISAQDTWELRSVLLLWLALLLTVPFSLSALSSASPPLLDVPTFTTLFAAQPVPLAQRVTALALPILSRPGKEGAYASLVLARLYSREDAVTGLPGFWAWAGAELAAGEREAEANFTAALLNMLALLPAMIDPRHLGMVVEFMDTTLFPHLRGSRTAAGSGLIRKLAIKAKGRYWLARLGKGLLEVDDLPEGLEEHLDDLMNGLGDKDTIVRYSSAKYLARISALLPPGLSSQIALATIALFSGTEDEPVIMTSFGTVLDPGGSSAAGTMGFAGGDVTRGEARWHGVCLAIAEMARRGLLDAEAVGEAVGWVLKALTFDLRRASHSIGSNVRDAAAYVLWSLSRACPPATLAPFAESIATALVCVAVFDREVGVRRAASAAFQEGVGRLGLYPEGIDVLTKTDFYSVSVRRVAFTAAVPAVAVHATYRRAMRSHLHHITLRHWDSAMRTLSARALRALLDLGPEDTDDAIGREMAQLASLDAACVHGALVALTKVCGMLRPDDERRGQIFAALNDVRPAALVTHAAAEVIQAACELIAASLSPNVAVAAGTQAVLDRYTETACRRREGEVHEALAAAYGRVSELRNASGDVARLIGDLSSIRAAQKQAAALCLGHVRYALCAASLPRAVDALLAQLAAGTKADIGTRRYVIRSLADIACREDLPVASTGRIFDALVNGLDDYSTDQRGDVGSWVRVVAVRAIARVTVHVSAQARLTAAPAPATPVAAGARAIDQPAFERAVGGMARLAAEKLEVVRAAVGATWADMRDASVVWEWQGSDALAGSQDDLGAWYASVVSLLATRYRSAVVAGLTSSIGSQVASTSSAALSALTSYLVSHPALVGPVSADLVALLRSQINANRTFLPVLATATRLVEAGLLGAPDAGAAVALAVRGVKSVKSVDRIAASMRLVVAATKVELSAVDALPLFLAHRFPRIRTMTAEALYLVLAEADDDVAPALEEVLLETAWTDDVGDAPDRVVALLRA